MSSKDNRYVGIVMEEVRDMFKAIQEGQSALVDVPKRLSNLENDMSEVKADIRVIKKVLTDQSGTLHNHERRITALENR